MNRTTANFRNFSCCTLAACIISSGLCIAFLLSVTACSKASKPASSEISINSRQKAVFSNKNAATLFIRRLLVIGTADDGGASNRIGASCSKENIVIFQGPTSPLPNGIPTYTVQIQNVCVTGCSISNIHVSCGWFSSARLIDPNLFKRVSYDDCLVNDGEPIGPGESLSFQYANSFEYPLSVSSVMCY